MEAVTKKTKGNCHVLIPRHWHFSIKDFHLELGRGGHDPGGRYWSPSGRRWILSEYQDKPNYKMAVKKFPIPPIFLEPWHPSLWEVRFVCPLFGNCFWLLCETHWGSERLGQNSKCPGATTRWGSPNQSTWRHHVEKPWNNAGRESCPPSA